MRHLTAPCTTCRSPLGPAQRDALRYSYSRKADRFSQVIRMRRCQTVVQQSLDSRICSQVTVSLVGVCDTAESCRFTFEALSHETVLRPAAAFPRSPARP